MMPRSKIKEGQRFGKWTAIREAKKYIGISGNKKSSARRFFCRCDCGTTRLVMVTNLIKGTSTSCNCGRIIHGECRKLPGTKVNESSLLYIHRGILSRCYNKDNVNYSNYGGRGIKVYKQWHKFLHFRNDIIKLLGPRQKGMSIDRKNTNKGYYPKNIKWSTQKQQMRNMRKNIYLVFRGAKRCVTEWSEITGLPLTTLNYRIAKGWPTKRILMEPRNLYYKRR